MLKPEIDWQLCCSCSPCPARQVCKTRAIIQIDPGEPPYIEDARCSRCGQCVLSCECTAITMRSQWNAAPGLAS